SLRVLWEPEGLWEPEEACRFARQLGIDVMVRAFHAGRPIRSSENPEILVGSQPWIRVDAIGRRPRLSADQIDALVEHIEHVPDAHIVFAGPRAVQNLQALTRSLALSA